MTKRFRFPMARTWRAKRGSAAIIRRSQASKRDPLRWVMRRHG